MCSHRLNYYVASQSDHLTCSVLIGCTCRRLYTYFRQQLGCKFVPLSVGTSAETPTLASVLLWQHAVHGVSGHNDKNPNDFKVGAQLYP